MNLANHGSWTTADEPAEGGVQSLRLPYSNLSSQTLFRSQSIKLRFLQNAQPVEIDSNDQDHADDNLLDERRDRHHVEAEANGGHGQCPDVEALLAQLRRLGALHWINCTSDSWMPIARSASPARSPPSSAERSPSTTRESCKPSSGSGRTSICPTPLFVLTTHTAPSNSTSGITCACAPSRRPMT